MKQRIFLQLISLLGFTAAAAGCSSSETNEAPEYGCPWAEFSVKGLVTDTEKNPIEGIRIVIEAEKQERFTVVTGSDGRYALTERPAGTVTGNVTVTADDIDGPENGGVFASRSETLSISGEDYTGADGWYRGSYEGEVDFALEKAAGDE